MDADAFDAAILTFALPFVSFFAAFEAALLFDAVLFDAGFADAGFADARAGFAGFFDFGAGLEDLNADAPDRPAGGSAHAVAWRVANKNAARPHEVGGPARHDEPLLSFDAGQIGTFSHALKRSRNRLQQNRRRIARYSLCALLVGRRPPF